MQILKNYQYLKSNKIASGEKSNKYFTGYLQNDNEVKPLHAILPKTSAYVKSYDEQTKWMCFLIENDDLLEKYITIWDKVSPDVKNNLITSLSTIKNIKKQK